MAGHASTAHTLPLGLPWAGEIGNEKICAHVVVRFRGLSTGDGPFGVDDCVWDTSDSLVLRFFDHIFHPVLVGGRFKEFDSLMK